MKENIDKLLLENSIGVRSAFPTSNSVAVEYNEAVFELIVNGNNTFTTELARKIITSHDFNHTPEQVKALTFVLRNLSSASQDNAKEFYYLDYKETSQISGNVILRCPICSKLMKEIAYNEVRQCKYCNIYITRVGEYLRTATSEQKPAYSSDY